MAPPPAMLASNDAPISSKVADASAKAATAPRSSPELRNLWDKELREMRDRIHAMRRQLVDQLKQRTSQDFSFILQQRGMFSYSGLSKEAVQALRTRHAVYAIDSGRICVAALNSQNLEYVAIAIADVLQ